MIGVGSVAVRTGNNNRSRVYAMMVTKIGGIRKPEFELQVASCMERASPTVVATPWLESFPSFSSWLVVFSKSFTSTSKYPLLSQLKYDSVSAE